MNEKNNKGYGCLLGIIFIAVVAVIMCILGIRYISVDVLKEKLVSITSQMQEYIDELNGGSKIEENLVFPEEEKLTEAQRYYYYQQLSDTAKKIYVTIEDNIEGLKNGEDTIPLPASLNEVAKSNENGKEMIANEFQSAWDAFITDKSEYFYLDSSKVCLVSKITTKGSNTNYEFFIGKGENANYFTKEYNSREEVESAIKKVEMAKTEILKNASGSNYQKMLYVHDWIVDNTKYDVNNGKNTSNIYGCLVNKSAICEGYARTYKYLLDELGIPCVIVSGTAIDENGKTERHAWNYVYINNNWYAVDTTWDDPIIIGNGKVNDKIKYKYFLKGRETMEKDHITSGRISKEGIEFKYPELGEEDLR